MKTNICYQGDCLDVLPTLPSNSVDSIVTDPPYELGFMGKKWDNSGIAYSVPMWKECLRVLKPGGHLLSFSGNRTYHRMAVAIEDAGFEIRDMIEWVYSTGFPKSLNVYKHLQKKCKCGNMEVYENRIKQMGKDSEAETEYFLRFMQEADLSQTISPEKKQGKVLQSGLSEQSSHRTVQGEEPEESSKGREERVLERGNNTKKTEGELQGSDLSEMPERVFSDGEERRIHNATQAGDGSAPKQTTNENGSSASQRPQSEQQQYREPCAFCKQWGTQAIRTLGVGTALKPAHEPICMARKPLSEKTVAENCLKYGTGGINIDESRVEYQSEVDKASATPQGKCTSNTSAGSAPDVDMSEVDYNGEKYWYKNEYKWLIDKWLNDEDYVWSELKENLETYDWCKVPEIDNGDRVLFDSQEGVCVRLYESKRKEFERPDQLGRFPANLIHDNSEEVRECFPETKSGNLLPGHKRGDGTGNSLMGGGGIVEGTYGGDSGNASRFFKSIIYQAKASKSERNKGCEGLEEKLDRPFEERLLAQCKICGNKGLKVGAGKQFTCGHTEIEYVKTEYKPSSNNHPTVKPIALMEYLIKMITPKGGIVLDPFAGSGSTLVAAKENDFNFIGIELTEEYIPIIEARTGVKAIKPENPTDCLTEEFKATSKSYGEGIADKLIELQKEKVELKSKILERCPKCNGRLKKTKYGMTCEDCLEDF